MDAFLRDARSAVRGWRLVPGPIIAALVALSLGISAAVAIFSVVSGVLLRPLPYQNPERLVMVWQDLRGRGGPPRDWISPGLFVEWRQRATFFERLAAMRGWGPNLTGIAEPALLQGAAVSSDYFQALGVQPARGRLFTDDEDRPDAEPVVIVSDALWKRSFSADPALVGRAIQLDGRPATVVGIMPAEFDPPILPAEIWTPIRIDPATAPRGIIVLRVLGKLKPGITLAQAQAGMNAIAMVLEREDAEWERARTAVLPLHEEIVGSVRQPLAVLAVAVLLVLAIACANVASLLLARAVDRAREITIRAALGASRWRITRQLLTESLVLAVAAGVAGVCLAWWEVRALVALAPASAPRLHDVRLDGGVLTFAVFVTLLTAIVAGLAPASASFGPQLNARLRDGGREATGTGKIRAVLVAAEIAAALVLAVGAALLVHTLVALQRVDLGFNPDHLLTARLVPPRAQYPDIEARRKLFERIVERARVLPGVTDAAITNMLPLSGGEMNLSFAIEGRPPAPPGQEPVAAARIVSASYLETMGMHLRAGRTLNRYDKENAPGAVVVNESMAEHYWPGQSPLGARVSVGPLDAVVVGVVGDVHHRGPGAAPGPEMYIPFTQFNVPQATLVVRTASDAATLATAVRASMKDVDPSLPLGSVTPMNTLLARNLSQPRFLAALLTAFALLASLLALVGVYGMLSFSVSRRVRELGVRIALGAGRGRVLRLVLGQSALLVLGGIVAGTALSAALSRLLQVLLFGVRAGDATTLAATAGAIALCAMAASVPPALRASRVDPVVALRAD
ncbi:MAG TPA: ABC transporter permease [Vicinamibacterales bacterium]|nr:ABC transporter permease [Vicinamibacterales bacterium]